MTAPNVSAEQAEEAGEERSAGAGRLLLRTGLGLLGLMGAVALAARFFREPLQAVGLWFVHHFGLGGMFLGTFLADAFSFPVPPQFYLWTAIAGGGSQVVAVAVICVASVLAGGTGYVLAARLGTTPFIARLLERPRRRLDPIFHRHGAWAIALGSITPVPYSMLCYLAGLYRMPPRLFFLLAVLRIPRILFFYAAIRAGWASFS